MWILSILFLIYPLNATTSTTRLTSTQAQHTWDLFKLHNVHILAEISVPRPGFIFQTISDAGKHLVDLLLLPDHKVSLTLPLKSGWTRRYTLALPTNQQKFVTLVTLEGKHVSVVVNCVQLLLENIDDVAFTGPVTCPVLTCSPQHRVVPPNRCCPVCVGADFCADAHCHHDAECINHPNGAQCKCKEGFYGDGYACHDIDECSFDSSAREQLGGCSSGSTCINEPGSFRCECLPNHQRIDSRNCVELLRV
ncbi:hypothetical protein Aduo_019299 [Ancylostoma duodenale]